MPVNASATVQALIEHKTIFFKIMDHNAQTAGTGPLVFTRAIYNRLLAAAAKPLESNERTRLYDTLGIQNLGHAGLTLYDDPNSGRFELLGWVVDMLRFFDDRRLKSLSSSDLMKLHDEIAHAHTKVFDHRVIWSIDDADLQELIVMVHETFSSVASRMHQNIHALDSNSKRLGELVSSEEYEDMDFSSQYVKALGEIVTIYERNIIPTMHFLDPHLDVKAHGSSPPMAMLEDIQKLLDEKKRFDDAGQLRRIIVQLYSQTNEVKLIRDGLDVYVSLATEQRRKYNTMEARYNRLKEAVMDKQDGRQKGGQLKPSNPLFEDSKKIFGLKVHSKDHQANIDWPTVGGRMLLDERLRTRVENYHPEIEVDDNFVPVAVNPAAEARRAAQTLGRIESRMRSFNFSKNCLDAHIEIHRYLAPMFTEYELHHLVDALEMAKVPDVWQRSTAPATIEHQGQQLSYYPLYAGTQTNSRKSV